MPGILSPGRIAVKCARYARVLRMAQAPHLTAILPGKTIGTYRKDGRKPEPDVLTLTRQDPLAKMRVRDHAALPVRSWQTAGLGLASLLCLHVEELYAAGRLKRIRLVDQH